jgi:hypothetical protein
MFVKYSSGYKSTPNFRLPFDSRPEPPRRRKSLLRRHGIGLQIALSRRP